VDDLDGDGREDDEVDEVRNCLWKFHREIYQCFDCYAACSSLDMFSMSSNEFRQFTEDTAMCIVGSKACDQGHLDTLFIAVNTGVARKAPKRVGKKGQNDAIKAAAAVRDMTLSAADVEADNKFNSVKSLNRQEFFQCLVKIAAMRYVMSGTDRDMSLAVEKLFNHMAKRLPPYAKHNADEFRAQYCYIEETDTVLRKYEHSLNIIYSIYSESQNDCGGKAGGATALKTLMGFDEYMGMVSDLELIEPSFSMREAKLAFIWSRMRAVDELHPKCRAKIYNLSLEDFYEALVRIAMLKSWPTDDEIRNGIPGVSLGGHADAGQFFLGLRAEGGKQAHMEFLNTRDSEGGENQPVWRKLEHLLTLILRTIESRGSDSGADMKLTRKEVTAFIGKK